MPVVIVRTVVGSTQEQKEQAIERITEVMRDVMGKNPETTHVLFEEFAEENWGLRGKSVAQIRKGK